jgi:hypothetical protein
VPDTDFVQGVRGYTSYLFDESALCNPRVFHLSSITGQPEDISAGHNPEGVPGTDEGDEWVTNNYPSEWIIVDEPAAGANFCGFQNPLFEGAIYSNRGALPVKFQEKFPSCPLGTPVGNDRPIISAYKIGANTVGIPQTVVSPGAANTGNRATFDTATQTYQYVLNTKGLAAGNYLLCTQSDTSAATGIPGSANFCTTGVEKTCVHFSLKQ